MANYQQRPVPTSAEVHHTIGSNSVALQFMRKCAMRMVRERTLIINETLPPKQTIDLQKLFAVGIYFDNIGDMLLCADTFGNAFVDSLNNVAITDIIDYMKYLHTFFDLPAVANLPMFDKIMINLVFSIDLLFWVITQKCAKLMDDNVPALKNELCALFKLAYNIRASAYSQNDEALVSVNAFVATIESNLANNNHQFTCSTSDLDIVTNMNRRFFSMVNVEINLRQIVTIGHGFA